MFVKPSNSTPSALRKARWEAAQKERNEAAQAALVAATLKQDRREASWETPRP